MTGGEPPRVRCEADGGVLRVTIDRPGVLNAMDLRTHEELAAAWDAYEADDDLRVAVLTGAGRRAFSVGQDLRERARLDADADAHANAHANADSDADADAADAAATAPSTFGSRGRPGWPRLTERFDLSKPVVARVDGYALGGGLELALACDVVIASDRSVVGLPEARLGLVPGAGGAFRLARQLPLKVAMGYLLTGRSMTAAEAFRMGLVNEVAPADRLDECVAQWTSDIGRSAPLAVRAIKEAVMRSLDMPLEDAFTASFPWEQKRRYSADAVEGPRAFAEKREPVWTGR